MTAERSLVYRAASLTRCPQCDAVIMWTRTGKAGADGLCAGCAPIPDLPLRPLEPTGQLALRLTTLAERCDVSRDTVERWVAEHGLPTMSTGGTRLVPVAWFEDWLKEHQTQ